MPFNGTGMFVRLRNWVADAAAGVKIRADYHDIEDDGFAAGLSQCIARDGQSVIINNIPMNGKRLTGLQDPIDPQDAVTKAYDDLKLPLAGGTITGSLTVNGTITSGATVTATGYRTRKGVPGPVSTGFFNFEWTGSLLNAWVDSTNLGALATQAYAESRASAWAATRLPLAGGTITGNLTVNGELVAASAYLRFQYSGSPGYIQWNGGGSYGLGGGGTIWHTGNLLPILDVRIVAGSGGVVTGVASTFYTNGAYAIESLKYGQLQARNPNGWYAVSGG